MIKKLYLSLFIGLLILIVVLISGYIGSSSHGNQSYNDKFISFDYPGDFQYTSVNYRERGGKDWQKDFLNVRSVLNVRNDKVYITVLKNENATNFTLSKGKEILAKQIVDMGGNYSSDTRKTNDNGVEVESTMFTLNDQYGPIKYIYYYFKPTDDIMYDIVIYGYGTNFVDFQSVGDTVFNSLKINK